MNMILNGNLSETRYQFAGNILSRLGGTLPSKIVLDIGAGDGRMKRHCESNGFEWQGFDLVPNSPEITRWDLNEPASFPDKAGAALLLDVIEHLGNPHLGLVNIAAALRSGGVLVITTPNLRWSRSRFFQVSTGYPACFTQGDLDLNGHVFPVFPHILEAFLKSTGFEV